MFSLTFKDGTTQKVNGQACLEYVDKLVRSHGQIVKMERA